RVIPLQVAGAFHTEYMAPATDGLAATAAELNLSDPQVTILSNSDGAVVASGREYVNRLVKQVTNPVRWDLCQETLLSSGTTGMIELVPGGTLTGIARRAMKGVETFAIKSAADLDGAREFAAAHAWVGKEDDMPTLRRAEPGTFSRITGIGAYRAENLVTNDDIAGPISSADEWIRQRTGIITRRRASEDVGVLDMCEE